MHISKLDSGLGDWVHSIYRNTVTSINITRYVNVCTILIDYSVNINRWPSTFRRYLLPDQKNCTHDIKVNVYAY